MVETIQKTKLVGQIQENGGKNSNEENGGKIEKKKIGGKN